MASSHLNISKTEFPGCWQVFGLADFQKTCVFRFLLAIASRFLTDESDSNQCYMTAVVSTYRCGAVPDFHRIPSCRDHNCLWSTGNEGQHIDIRSVRQSGMLRQFFFSSKALRVKQLDEMER